jgi:hypothetical protein
MAYHSGGIMCTASSSWRSYLGLEGPGGGDGSSFELDEQLRCSEPLW